MPVFFDQTFNRRNFVRVSLLGISTVTAVKSFTAESEWGKSTRWALLSDTHVPEDPANEYRGFKPYENIQTAVSQVLEAKPEGVIINGDLARLQGLPGDYANLKKFIAPFVKQIPVGLALGNHDHRKNFYDAFPDHPGRPQPVTDKHVLVIDMPHIRLVILDSLLYTNQVAGLLGKDQREWLDDFLRSTDETPTLLFFHHYPIEMDSGLLDMDRLVATAVSMRKVKALIFGHSHVYAYENVNGLHFINLPATGYNFKDDDPVGWVEATWTAEGGDFKLHAFGGNTQDHGKTRSLEWRV